jgi:hypothetical protein
MTSMTFLICFGISQYIVLSAVMAAAFVAEDAIKCNKGGLVFLFVAFALFWPALCAGKLIAAAVDLD